MQEETSSTEEVYHSLCSQMCGNTLDQWLDLRGMNIGTVCVETHLYVIILCMLYLSVCMIIVKVSCINMAGGSVTSIILSLSLLLCSIFIDFCSAHALI